MLSRFGKLAGGLIRPVFTVTNHEYGWGSHSGSWRLLFRSCIQALFETQAGRTSHSSCTLWVYAGARWVFQLWSYTGPSIMRTEPFAIRPRRPG